MTYDPNIDNSPSAGARAWLASKVWQEHEMNYLADFTLEDELQEALDHCLIQAFCAGAEWRENPIQTAKSQ